MLSFQREQRDDDAKILDGDSRQNEAATLSDQGQYYTVASRQKKVRQSTSLLVVSFCIGLVGLWFMIKKSQPQTASAELLDSEQTQIEMAITRLTGVSAEMLNRMDKIVKKFYEFSDVPQVDVSELLKNPFHMEFLMDITAEDQVDEQSSLEELEMLRQRQLREKAKQQAEKMKLSSIIQSERGSCCEIDGRIVSEGDIINGFQVVRIGEGLVELRWTAKAEGQGPTNQVQNLNVTLKLGQ